ncbi:MAG: PEP-CTERM sorting domain-containing protein [Proteobacteria bacterium]|nr:PEP-CTERM sorting domain-containing protein [Pseudomonadota bacterium]
MNATQSGSRQRIAGLAAVCLLPSLGLAAAAGAAPVLTITITDTSDAGGIFLNSSAGFDGAATSLGGDTGSSSTTGDLNGGSVRLGFGIGLDSCRLSPCSGPPDLQRNFTAEITATVVATGFSAAGAWQVDFAGARRGNIQILGDGGGGPEQVTLSAATWGGDVGGVFGAAFNRTSLGNDFFNDSGDAVLAGAGNGTFSVTLGVDSFVRSTPSPVFFSQANGDDACVRMGIDVEDAAPLSQALCTEYPGLGLANPNDHGLFLDYQVTAIPEPGALTLLGLGLFGLTLAGRPRRR